MPLTLQEGSRGENGEEIPGDLGGALRKDTRLPALHTGELDQKSPGQPKVWPQSTGHARKEESSRDRDQMEKRQKAG